MTSPDAPDLRPIPRRTGSGRAASRSAPRRVPAPPGRWRVALWRLRHLTAAVALAAACGVVATQLQAPDERSGLMVVTTGPLAAGAQILTEDVTTAKVSLSSVPVGSHSDVADVVGHTVAVSLPAGLPVVDALLADAAPAGPPGTVVVPVRFADAVVGSLLHPGDRVDVLASTTALDESAGTGRALARRALVLAAAVPATGVAFSGTGNGLMGGTDTVSSPMILLAVSPTEASEIAGAAGRASLSPVFVQ